MLIVVRSVNGDANERSSDSAERSITRTQIYCIWQPRAWINKKDRSDVKRGQNLESEANNNNYEKSTK